MGGVEVKMEAFRNKMLMKTAIAEERDVANESRFLF